MAGEKATNYFYKIACIEGKSHQSDSYKETEDKLILEDGTIIFKNKVIKIERLFYDMKSLSE